MELELEYTSLENFLEQHGINTKSFNKYINEYNDEIPDHFDLEKYETIYKLAEDITHSLDAADIVLDAFEWRDTPEGKEFWNRLDDLWKEFIFATPSKQQFWFPVFKQGKSAYSDLVKMLEETQTLEDV